MGYIAVFAPHQELAKSFIDGTGFFLILATNWTLGKIRRHDAGKVYQMKKKRTPVSIIRRPVCLKCGTHFSKRKVVVVYRDVVECTFCGHVWVLLDKEEFDRWN